jgi:transcriptional regulator with XRE-family HTH domain
MVVMDLQSIIAWNINRLRLKEGISQLELALRCDVLHQNFISTLESGAHNPSIQTLAILASAFGVTIAELYSIEGAPPHMVTGPLVYESRRHGTKTVEIDLSVFGPLKNSQATDEPKA